VQEISLIKLLLESQNGPFGWLLVGLVFLIIIQKLFIRPLACAVNEFLQAHIINERARIQGDSEMKAELRELNKSLDHVIKHTNDLMQEMLNYLRRINGKENDGKERKEE
jgi:hypothetical protein